MISIITNIVFRLMFVLSSSFIFNYSAFIGIGIHGNMRFLDNAIDYLALLFKPNREIPKR